MKPRLLILLAAALAASPAAGQTIKSLGYNTTNGNIVAATNVTFTNSVGFATNARAATRTNLGGTTVGNALFTAATTNAARVALGATVVGENIFTVPLQYQELFLRINADNTVSSLSPAATRTNLGLGATNDVTFSNITASGTLGVTGNATLSGTDNLAPSQTTNSASSLMTRGLSDARYRGLTEVLEELARPPMTLGSTIVEAANSGSGFIAWTRQQNQVAQLTTSVATNSPAGYSRAGFYQWAQTSGSTANTPLSRGWSCGFILNSQTDSTGGLSTSIGFGVPGTYQGGALTNRGLRVTLTGNGTGHTVTAAAHNGTSELIATNAVATGGLAAGIVVQWSPVLVSGIPSTNSTLSVYGRAANGNPTLITQLTLTNSIGASDAVGNQLAFAAHSTTNSPTYVANFEISGFTTKWH